MFAPNAMLGKQLRNARDVVPLCDECLYGDVCLKCLEEEVLGE
jgi:hypothetical protein